MSFLLWFMYRDRCWFRGYWLFMKCLLRFFYLCLLFLRDNHRLFDIFRLMFFFSLSGNFLDKGVHGISRCLCINSLFLLLCYLNYWSLFFFHIDYRLNNLNLWKLGFNIGIFGFPVYFFLLFILLIFLCIIWNNMFKRMLGRFLNILYCESRNIFDFGPSIYNFFLLE